MHRTAAQTRIGSQKILYKGFGRLYRFKWTQQVLQGYMTLACYLFGRVLGIVLVDLLLLHVSHGELVSEGEY
jgi:hypothetical protein